MNLGGGACSVLILHSSLGERARLPQKKKKKKKKRGRVFNFIRATIYLQKKNQNCYKKKPKKKNKPGMVVLVISNLEARWVDSLSAKV